MDFKALKEGDEVFVLSPRMREHELPYWRRAKVGYITGGQDGIVVRLQHYRVKDGVHAHNSHPIPGRISLSTPEILDIVEKTEVWSEVYEMVRKQSDWSTDQLHSALGALRKIKERPARKLKPDGA